MHANWSRDLEREMEQFVSESIGWPQSSFRSNRRAGPST